MRVAKFFSGENWIEDFETGYNWERSDSHLSVAIPGFRNCHSHAFQYAMAGLAENHLNPKDDFWSWREAMYKLALAVEPEDIESIATMLYLEMRRAGYTHVAEFHYLHHDRNGESYDNPAEISTRLMSAAENVGIKLTLVPVFYKKGGFGKPSLDEQRRFVFENSDHYLRFVDSVKDQSKSFSNVGVGVGIHSLRAADQSEINDVIEYLAPDMPFHIHIAEQPLEVADCVEFYGARPVEWFLGEFAVDERFNLVHATHVNENELKKIVDTDAAVVICPTTEGNLGDGVFPLKEFMKLGGKWSIGTDSHVSLDPFEEIRLLDYGQRLTSNSRNTFGENGALNPFESAFKGAESALIPEHLDGHDGDLLIIETNHPNHLTAKDEDLLNTLIYSGSEMHRLTLVDGHECTLDYRDVSESYLATLRGLRNN